MPSALDLRPDCHGDPERLRQLEVRWICEERAVSQLLLELECELDHVVRELSFRRLLGEPCDTLEERAMLLQAECDALTDESAHVRLALTGVRAELQHVCASPAVRAGA